MEVKEIANIKPLDKNGVCIMACCEPKPIKAVFKEKKKRKSFDTRYLRASSINRPSKNKLTNYVKTNGIKLGSGCDRTAYYLESNPSKVYKIPHSTSNQNLLERAIYHEVPVEFKVFFPSPQWSGRICIMEKITTFKDMECESEDIFDNLEEFNVDYDEELFNDFLDWIGNFSGGNSDIANNPGNVGVNENGELKICDWGWSTFRIPEKIKEKYNTNQNSK